MPPIPWFSRTVFLCALIGCPLVQGQTNNLRSGLGPASVAVVVNVRDPVSVEVGNYYFERHGIPAANLIHVDFKPGVSVMKPAEFKRLKQQVDAQVSELVQVFALTWVAPYRVGCMSITTAFAAGFAPTFCAKACRGTRMSPYFDSDSVEPFVDYGMRPAVIVGGSDLESTKRLIDRGVLAQGSHPNGTAYLVSTQDKARNVRAFFYQPVTTFLGKQVRVRTIEAQFLEGKDDVLFYFTGIKHVEKLATNRFVPGAIADHLTSAGGKLTDSSQMSVLKWIDAGATGTYGTVVEPCNLLAKFPNPMIAMKRYLAGETLVEAYWKSVAMPGQGVFVGDPLSRPFN